MDYPLRRQRARAHDHPEVAPWRNAALIAAAVAVVELVLLIVVVGALLAKPEPRGTAARTQSAALQAAAAAPAKATPKPAPAPAAQLPRRKVSVLVLNGNGQQGAAAAEASRVSAKGYRIRAVANAPSRDYTRTLVMYRPGFEGEGRRLARDLRIGIVGPLDGMRARQLQGAHVIVVVGA